MNAIPRHSTETGYTHDGCRCPECRAAAADARRARRLSDDARFAKQAAYKREWRRRRRAEGLSV